MQPRGYVCLSALYRKIDSVCNSFCVSVPRFLSIEDGREWVHNNVSAELKMGEVMVVGVKEEDRVLIMMKLCSGNCRRVTASSGSEIR